jgi:hypothetical protein
MSLNDNAVVTAAQGFVFTAAVGTAAPTPSTLDTVDPALFGSQTQTVVVSGAPTSYTLDVDGEETTALPLASTAATVQAALEALDAVGAGNVTVTGTSAATPGLTITWIEALQGSDLDIVEGTFVGGTDPEAVITETTAINGWKNLGHTSREDMPEFGFDGGDTEVKGTWQKKRLREVATGDPVADFVTVNLQQWDMDSLELYFGADSASTPGVFGVSGDFVPVEKALLIIIVDGDVRLGFYAPKASLKRDDSVDLPVDEFASLPVKATFLNHGVSRLYDWISEDLFGAA